MKVEFRAWDESDNKMIGWQFLLHGCNLKNVFKAPEQCGLVLMQSTGLKDKNGVEIYVGDICSVEVNMWGALVTRTGEVTFNEYDLQFQIMSGNDWAFFTKEYFEKCEVIGNVYQNSELLEVQP